MSMVKKKKILSLKGIQIRKKQVKLSLITEEMVLHRVNPKNIIKLLEKQIY